MMHECSKTLKDSDGGAVTIATASNTALTVNVSLHRFISFQHVKA